MFYLGVWNTKVKVPLNGMATNLADIKNNIICFYSFIPVFHWAHYTTVNLPVCGFSGGILIVYQASRGQNRIQESVLTGSKAEIKGVLNQNEKEVTGNMFRQTNRIYLFGF